MNFELFFAILIGMQLLCLLVGWWSSRGVKNQNDYYLAGENVPFFPLMMAFIATQVGGGFILGSSDEAFKFGWWILFYPLGGSLGMIIVAMGLGKRIRTFPIKTVVELFELVYKSTTLRKLASLLSMASLMMFLIGQIVSSHKFMLALGVDDHLIFLTVWGVITVYTVLGGLRAVVATNLIQGLFFIAIFTFTFFYMGNPTELFSEGTQKLQLPSSDTLLGWFLMPLLFMLFEQDMVQKCLASDSLTHLRRATFWAGLATLAISLIPIYFGMAASDINLKVAPGASVFMTYIVKHGSPAIVALVGCAIASAIFTTATSMLNAISSNLSQDFPFTQHTVRFSQFLTTIIAIIAVAISYQFDNIVDLLVESCELSVSCLFIPIMGALFRFNGSTLSAALSMAFGAFGFIFFRIFPTEFPHEILSLALSATGFLIGKMTATEVA